MPLRPHFSGRALSWAPPKLLDDSSLQASASPGLTSTVTQSILNVLRNLCCHFSEIPLRRRWNSSAQIPKDNLFWYQHMRTTTTTKSLFRMPFKKLFGQLCLLLVYRTIVFYSKQMITQTNPVLTTTCPIPGDVSFCTFLKRCLARTMEM